MQLSSSFVSFVVCWNWNCKGKISRCFFFWGQTWTSLDDSCQGRTGDFKFATIEAEALVHYPPLKLEDLHEPEAVPVIRRSSELLALKEFS